MDYVLKQSFAVINGRDPQQFLPAGTVLSTPKDSALVTLVYSRGGVIEEVIEAVPRPKAK